MGSAVLATVSVTNPREREKKGEGKVKEGEEKKKEN